MTHIFDDIKVQNYLRRDIKRKWWESGPNAVSFGFANEEEGPFITVMQGVGGALAQVQVSDSQMGGQVWMVQYSGELLGAITRAVETKPCKEIVEGVLIAYNAVRCPQEDF